MADVPLMNNPMTDVADSVIGGVSGAPTRLKNNWSASVAPAATDDSGDGYAIGSRWIDTTADKEYVALDVTVGAAVWTETTASAGGSGISSGTSNPVSPTDGDLFYRSDLDLLIRYRSTGTRWVCTCPHTQNVSHQDQLTPASVTHSARASYPAALTSDILIESVTWGVSVNATNDGTKYWTLAAPNGVLMSTAAIAAATPTKLTSTTQLSVALASWAADCAVSKVSTPGTIYYTIAFTYRYIVT